MAISDEKIYLFAINVVVRLLQGLVNSLLMAGPRIHLANLFFFTQHDGFWNNWIEKHLRGT
jgi:hypothetical protein